jgi:hypothetical protein
MFVTKFRKDRQSSLYELNQSIPHSPIQFRKFQYLPPIYAQTASLNGEGLANLKLLQSHTVRKDSPEGHASVKFY